MTRKVYRVKFTMPVEITVDVEATNEDDAIVAAEVYCGDDLEYDFTSEATEAPEGVAPEIVAEDYLLEEEL